MKVISDRVPLENADAKKRERCHKWLRRMKTGAGTRPDKRTQEFAVGIASLLGVENWTDLWDGSVSQIARILRRFSAIETDDDPDSSLANRFHSVLEKSDSELRRRIEGAVAAWEESISSQSVDRADGVTCEGLSNHKTSPVVVKWSGSKRLQSAEIIRHFPTDIETYFEPFLGGASLLLAVMASTIRVKRFRCSDSNAPLIGIWNLVKNAPDTLMNFYESYWHRLRQDGSKVFDETRERFNEDQDPLKFFALLRTCRNGLVRFNKENEFNVSFHHGRRGIRPENLRPLLEHWSSQFNNADVQFEVKDYRSVKSDAGDFLYLDPQYPMPDNRPIYMYSGEFNLSKMWSWLEQQKGTYALSLGGFRNGEDRRVAVPRHLYDKDVLLEPRFHRLVEPRGESRDILYVKSKNDF